MKQAVGLDKEKIKQSFSAASLSYDQYAKLQREVALALLNDCNIENPNGTLVDLGCGTGFLTAELLRLMPFSASQAIIALDIALPMLRAARCKLAHRPTVRYLCADAERLPLVGQSVDAVFSSLALQWCSHPETLFADIKRILRPGGQLFFSTFGSGTLQELKQAWSEVDSHCHVNDFFSEEQLQQFLQNAGFRQIQMAERNYRPTYDSVIDLMKELKAIGAHNVTLGRNKHLTTRAQLQQMISAYESQQAGPGVSATFTAFLISARA